MNYRFLDVTRAVAAVLVLVSHARSFLLVDYDEIAGSRSPLVRAIYFLSGFGHQSVLVFFVLSGFLISGSIMRGVENASWRWSDYAIHRLTRLFIVLLPCLVLTFALDEVAIALSGSGFYAGDPNLNFSSGPPLGGVSLTGATFAGNLFFLQTIAVPVLGSNGPLWSLAYEFWYYVLFPLGFLTWTKRHRLSEVTVYTGLLLLVVLILAHSAVLALFPVWLLGSVVALADRHPALRRVTRRPLTILLLSLLFVVTLVLARLNILPDLWSELAFAITYAMLMACLLQRSATSVNPLLHVTDRVAAMSFSLYLMHFPLLAAIHAVVFHDRRLQPNGMGLLSFICVTAAVFGCCYVFYLMFEAHTARVRGAVTRWLGFRNTKLPVGASLGVRVTTDGPLADGGQDLHRV